MAWLVVVVILPVVGIVGYILLGETSIGRRRVARMREVLARMPAAADTPGNGAPNSQPRVSDLHAHLFRAGRSVNGFEPVGGNSARLLPDSNASIELIVTDIDQTLDSLPRPVSSGGR